MNTNETTFEFTTQPAGKSRHKITVKEGGKPVFLDTVNVASAAGREKFIATVCERLPGLDRSWLEAELLQVAATEGDTVARVDHLEEVDVARVVPPEAFHTADVSGITVPVILNGGVKPVARWRTYLKWADGMHDVIDAPDRLLLPGGTTLFIAPEPGEPPGFTAPVWSSASRRGWLDEDAAPNPAAVFESVRQRFNAYLDFPAEVREGTVATLALWTVLSYLYSAWDAVPYLYIGGPMGSGKSRLLDVLQRLVFRPTRADNVSVSVVFRSLHANGGTFMFDEAERLKQSTPDQQDILGMFLAGYRRGGRAVRNESVGDGKFKTVHFDVFGPKLLACIAGLPPTLASRCIPITMFRSAADSSKLKVRLDANPAEWQRVRDELHVLALDCGTTWPLLAARSDVVPAGISGRNYELWQPLLALARWFQDQGVENLLDLVQGYAVASVRGAKDDTIPEADEVLLELLAQSVIDHRPMTSAELLTAARTRDDITFKAWQPRTVTSRLKSYGIAAPQKSNGERRYRREAAGRWTRRSRDGSRGYRPPSGRSWSRSGS